LGGQGGGAGLCTGGACVRVCCGVLGFLGGRCPALLGLGGGSVHGCREQPSRLCVRIGLGAFAAHRLDAGGAVEGILKALGGQDGVELDGAHSLLVCVGSQEREKHLRLVGRALGTVCIGTGQRRRLGGAFELRFRAVAGHIGVGGGGLSLGDRLTSGSELSVEGLDLGDDVLLGLVSGGDLFRGRGWAALGEGRLGEDGREHDAAHRGSDRAR
jgi:hypothetical protein